MKPQGQDILPDESLVFHHVTVKNGDTVALQDVSLELPCSGCIAVVGPNGAGKTTLFRALLGLVPLQEGDIYIHGKRRAEYNQSIAFVPQREEIDWTFPATVWDVVAMGRLRKGFWIRPLSRDDKEIISKSLVDVGLWEVRGRTLVELSGGQQQRVFLARALAQQPHILILDEPFNGVDLATQQAVLTLFETLKQQGVTVLVSTHDLNLARNCFEIVVLLNKCVVAAGSPVEVFTPNNLARAFAGQMITLGNQAVVVNQCCGNAPSPLSDV